MLDAKTLHTTHQGKASHREHQEIYMQESPAGLSIGHFHYPDAFPSRSWWWWHGVCCDLAPGYPISGLDEQYSSTNNQSMLFAQNENQF
jgi:hypothetical protein